MAGKGAGLDVHPRGERFPGRRGGVARRPHSPPHRADRVIRLDRGAGRWTVTLDRADKANALSLAMLERLDTVFAEAQADPDLRVLVVTGAGERAFCAGADLAEARDATAITTNPLWDSVSRRLANLPCLTIAALNGTLAGGGFGLALACDLRLAVPEAKFFYPVLRNGFLPQHMDVQRMQALIGPSRTRLILLAGQKLGADEALAIGLIDRIVERADMAAEIDILGAAALAGKPEVLVAIKRMGQAGADVLDDCYAAVYRGDDKAHARLRGWV
ncbi:MAG: enoyl-CoA hydratase/isomerase family protein [Rhodobacteraceae bacterium]|nr:enoyl-CoA hydratase/isomerase family protein [Paracoccaceae bacterium]